jgi:hypothetical protein
LSPLSHEIATAGGQLSLLPSINAELATPQRHRGGGADHRRLSAQGALASIRGGYLTAPPHPARHTESRSQSFYAPIETNYKLRRQPRCRRCPTDEGEFKVSAKHRRRIKKQATWARRTPPHRSRFTAAEKHEHRHRRSEARADNFHDYRQGAGDRQSRLAVARYFSAHKHLNPTRQH